MLDNYSYEAVSDSSYDVNENLRNNKAHVISNNIYHSTDNKIINGHTLLYLYIKRIFDIFFSLSLLILLCPIFIIISLALQIDSPGPLFFTQMRIGHNGSRFRCFKFRTMCVNAEWALADILEKSTAARLEWSRDHKLKNDPRVTKLGGIVRKLSVDELPQLVNILLGQMSVVGPRPIVEAEITKYGEYFADYCSVKPGLTGLWQVCGRNDVTYDERVALDRRYSASCTFGLDLWIVLRTIPAVVEARGSY